MNNYVLMPSDESAEFFLNLLFCRATMAAGGNQDGDSCIWISLADFGEHSWNNDFAWNRTGMVTRNQDDIAFSLGKFGKSWTADGISQRIVNQLFLAFVRHIVVQFGNQNTMQTAILKLQ